MKLTDNQCRYIENRCRDLTIFLSGNPRKGDLNARLEKQWWNMILELDRNQ